MSKVKNSRLQQLAEKPYPFDFYQAMRLIECHYADKPRIGGIKSIHPKDDAIRLGQPAFLIFAPSTIASVELTKTSDSQGTNISSDFAEIKKLSVYFLGLFGSHGAMPLHVTELALEQQRDGSSLLSQFLDMFHHRLISLFYRAWANKEPTVQYDRPESNNFNRYLGSLLGIGTADLQNRDEMPDNSKMYFAAHMSSQTKHAEGLLRILQEFFKVPVTIKEFVGEWLDIPQQSQCVLGGFHQESGKLGIDSVIGTKSWQRQFKFTVVIGAMTRRDYEGLLPGREKLQLVASIIKNYLGMEMNWDINLILQKEEIPKMALGNYGQLGLTSWLYSKKPQQDAEGFVTA